MFLSWPAFEQSTQKMAHPHWCLGTTHQNQYLEIAQSLVPTRDWCKKMRKSKMRLLFSYSEHNVELYTHRQIMSLPLISYKVDFWLTGSLGIVKNEKKRFAFFSKFQPNFSTKLAHHEISKMEA